jgi:uncharacterized OB-fold protein
VTAEERTRFEPPASPSTERVWEATREGQLLLPWCLDCGRAHFYPRRRCPFCRGSNFEWRAAGGGGVVYALSVQHRPGWMGLADRVPYAVAVVELDEGVRIMGGLDGLGDAAGAAVGTRVMLGWEPLSDGRQLPMFTAA